MELEELSQQAKAFEDEYAREFLRIWTGLKKEADLEGIIEKHAALFSPELLQLADRRSRTAEGEDRERWRRLYYFCLDVAMARSSASSEDKLQNALAAEVVEYDGKKLPYFAIRPTIVSEADPKKREELFVLELSVVEKTNPLRQKAVTQAEESLTRLTGQTSASAYLDARKKIDHHAFLAAVEDLASKTQQLYKKHMGAWVKEEMKLPLGDLSAAHVEYFRKMPQFDEWFPGKDLLLVCHQSLDNLGFSLDQLPQIHVDASSRPQKNPRALCLAIDPPSEVHLIIKPTIGSDNYHQFMHEAGHALHFAYSDPKLVYELRALGNSSALPEVYSFLIESLTRNPEWLRQYLGIGEELAWRVGYYSTLVDLLFFQRYVAKLHYELEFNEAPTDWRASKKRYAETLTKATGFEYPSARFLDDMDGGLYSADYLRAWITAAQLRAYMTKEYGEKWFMEAKAGDFLKGLWAKGLSIENEDISKLIGAKPFDTSALLQEYHEVLTSNPV